MPDSDAMNNSGLLAYQSGDLKKAKKWWQLAADAGNSEGMYSLGLLAQESGDLKEAKKWWQLAADAGDSNAMTGLGALAQESGDLKEAKKWWQLAADSGESYAMNNLGLLAYQSGDMKKAKKWWQLAADAGNSEGMYSLGRLAEESGDLKEAKKWWQLAADAGSSGAMNYLGALAQESGDLKEAKKWYQLAADAGDSDAMNNLGSLAQESGREVENETFVSANASQDSIAIASNKALRIPKSDLFESTQYSLRKLVMLWELAREEGFQDSEGNEGISLDMFISSQMAILTLQRIFHPTDRDMKAFHRASQEFEELLGFPSIEVSPLDVESDEFAVDPEHFHIRYLKGLCHVRQSKDQFDIDNFRSKFDLLLNETVSGKKASDIFVEIAPAIIDLLWQAFAKLEFNFYCNHFYDKYDEDFGLFDFEYEKDVKYFASNIGTPSWAEVFIEFVDRDELNWNDWGDGFLDGTNNDRIHLLYAAMNSYSDRYAITEHNINWYWPKIDSTDEIDLDINVIQSTSYWWSNNSFHNVIEYGVTPDLKYIHELETARGISYVELSSEQIMKLISIATETLEHPDIGLNKVVHYILSLIWSHPHTPLEGKVFIALLKDEHIRKFGEDEDDH